MLLGNVFQKETQTQNGQWPELCPLGLKKQNNEFNQPTKYTSDDMIHFKVQQQQGKQAETGEAWALPEKGATTINSAIILGAIGEFNLPFLIIEKTDLKTCLSEKKLMPMIVLSASIIYIGVAATFYFDII